MSETKKEGISFKPQIPIVHSLNSYVLIREGWERKGNVYTKEGREIKYDGVQWKQGNIIIKFLEDIK